MYRTETSWRLRRKCGNFDDCSGGRVGCFVIGAGGTPATTARSPRREGVDDLLETGVAAERVPERQQFQFAVADRARRANGNG
jgi:hypothetical protein